MAETLAEALEREHADIDAGIEGFTAGLSAGDPPVATMLTALAALRRHIYLEEAFLFPPMRAAGLFGPIMVMLNEHGQMWRTMAELQPILADDGVGGEHKVAEMCRQLVAQLQGHNPKEEQILYPQADTILNGPASAELREFMASGQTPEGWVCASA